MNTFFNTSLSTQQFLDEYWQKEPLLIRQAFPDFSPELDVNDMAGLACEELVESRLITGTYPAHDWTLRQGPFAEQDLSTLPDRNWTLLVQDVEKHYPPLRDLFESFDFLPSWRFDDLMVSVAAPGGSVGPHTDQYDVFLLQASGSRKWQIATAYDPELLPDSDLNVLKHFDAEREWTLEAGDMLYLPPAVAHHGVALETGMTWSIGMRAPSSADVFQAWGEWLAIHHDEGERYRDHRLTGDQSAGRIDPQTLAGMRAMLQREMSSRPTFDEFIGSFLSRYRMAHEPAAPEHQITLPELEQARTAGITLRHNPWTRLLWLPLEDRAMVFAAGEMFLCSEKAAKTVCRNPLSGWKESSEDDETAQLICRLINQGHLYLELDS